MKADKAWQAALGQLQMEMPKAAFDTWVSDAEFISYEDGSFIVGVKNAYARDWLENRLTSTVKRILTGIMNRTVELNFVVWQGLPEPTQTEKIERAAIQYESLTTNSNDSLNRRYSFESFVVGPSNRLAHAASLAVAEKPAQAYNPLFLYGGVGLGKTHLLQAIGNMCHQQGLQVRCLGIHGRSAYGWKGGKSTSGAGRGFLPTRPVTDGGSNTPCSGECEPPSVVIIGSASAVTSRVSDRDRSGREALQDLRVRVVVDVLWPGRDQGDFRSRGRQEDRRG